MTDDLKFTFDPANREVIRTALVNQLFQAGYPESLVPLMVDVAIHTAEQGATSIMDAARNHFSQYSLSVLVQFMAMASGVMQIALDAFGTSLHESALEAGLTSEGAKSISDMLPSD